MKKLASLIAVCILLSSPDSNAEWNIDLKGDSRIRISGFGTFGLATSDQANAELPRDIADKQGISSADLPFYTDSRLGLQLDAIINSQWSATVQAVVKDRPSQTLEESLQWAFINYRPTSDWQLRVGRVGLDIGLVSDQRNVGYSYLWVRPPIEFYGRLPLFQFNGGDVSYAFNYAEVDIRIKTFIGEASPFYPSNPDYKIAISPLWGGNVNLRWQDWHGQLSYVGTRIDSNAPGLEQLQSALMSLASFYPDALKLSHYYQLKNTNNHFISIGLAYEGDPWVAQSEFGRQFVGNGFITDVYVAYGSLGYRMGSVTPYINYSSIWPANSSPHLPSTVPNPTLAANLTVPFTNGNSNQETVSLGGRWDFYNNLALKLQYDLVHVRNNGAGLWQSEQSLTPHPHEFSNMFSATLDFVF